MNSEEIWQGNKIIKEGKARITWVSPNYFIFNIDTDEGTQEVYLRTKNGVDDWDCNVTWNQSDQSKWGCMLNTKVDRTKPYCRHTLACKIIHDKWLEENQWKPKNQ